MDATPDPEVIKQWALENLPRHYILESVQLCYGSDSGHLAPEDFEIRIEYANCMEEPLRGSMEAIRAHQRWSFPLRDKIRARWSARALRIGFVERLKEE